MKQPEALRLANALRDGTYLLSVERDVTAEELQRLHKANQAMLEALKDIKHGLEGSRIWGGMEWSYNPLHPFKYLPLVEKASAAIAEEREASAGECDEWIKNGSALAEDIAAAIRARSKT